MVGPILVGHGHHPSRWWDTSQRVMGTILEDHRYQLSRMRDPTQEGGGTHPGGSQSASQQGGKTQLSRMVGPIQRVMGTNPVR